jgi:hypothetical protein
MCHIRVLQNAVARPACLQHRSASGLYGYVRVHVELQSNRCAVVVYLDMPISVGSPSML